MCVSVSVIPHRSSSFLIIPPHSSSFLIILPHDDVPDTPATECLHTATRTKYSRIPVYKNGIDDIVGILFSKVSVVSSRLCCVVLL